MKRLISGLLLSTMIANAGLQARAFSAARIDEEVSFLTSVPAMDKNPLLELSLGKVIDPQTSRTDLENSFVFMDDPKVALRENAAKPLVQVDPDGTKRINGNYMEFQQTIHEMNDLSYAIAKRQSKSDELNKWIAAYNTNQEEYTAFKASLEDDFGVGCVDLFDILEELDYLDRKDFIKAQIKKLEDTINANFKRAREHLDRLDRQGWELKVIEGKTGYKSITGSDRSFVPDDRGFVAYHKATGTIVVTYHGSRDGNDWDTNFDGMKVRASEVGLHLPEDASLHRGFGNAVESCASQVKSAIRDFVRTHESKGGNRAQMNFYVTGHSQGAAVASISFMDLAINLGKELFGPAYRNAEGNHFKGIFFSAPRAIGGENVLSLNQEVGSDNMIRQNVHGDIVPIISMKEIHGAFKKFLQGVKLKVEYFRDSKTLKYLGLDEVIARFMEKPQFKELFNSSLDRAFEKFSGFSSVGHLALDHVGEASKRVFWSSVKSLGYRTLTNLMDVASNSIQRALGYKVQGPGIVDFLKNTAMDVLYTFFAPFHYGALQDEAGAAFHPDVVGKNPEQLLQAGVEHERAKSEPRPSIGERVMTAVKSTASSAWSTVKGWFGGRK